MDLRRLFDLPAQYFHNVLVWRLWVNPILSFFGKRTRYGYVKKLSLEFTKQLSYTLNSIHSFFSIESHLQWKKKMFSHRRTHWMSLSFSISKHRDIWSRTWSHPAWHSCMLGSFYTWAQTHLLTVYLALIMDDSQVVHVYYEYFWGEEGVGLGPA